MIRVKAPLRISFAGGGTDVDPFPATQGGCVLNATIDRFAWGSLTSRPDGKIQVQSVDMDLLLKFTVDTALQFDGKLDLAKAAIHRLGAQKTSGFDIFLKSEAPPGSGLGSSSAMIVALVALLKNFMNIPTTEYEIAETAYVLERQDLNIKGGYQDQYASTFGGFNFIEFHGDHVIVNPLRIARDVINELEHNLLLCYTGITRRSDGIIADQTARLESTEAGTVEGLQKQKELAIEMKNLLLRGRLEDFGDLLHTAWQYKKQLSPKITNSQIDEIYSEAQKAGAIGGKITGAGGGGYLLLYCPFEKKHIVTERVSKMGAEPLAFAFDELGVQTWRVHETGSSSR